MTDHDRPTNEQLRWLIRPDTFQKPIGWIVPMARELLELREMHRELRAMLREVSEVVSDKRIIEMLLDERG